MISGQVIDCRSFADGSLFLLPCITIPGHPAATVFPQDFVVSKYNSNLFIVLLKHGYLVSNAVCMCTN